MISEASRDTVHTAIAYYIKQCVLLLTVSLHLEMGYSTV